MISLFLAALLAAQSPGAIDLVIVSDPGGAPVVEASAVLETTGDTLRADDDGRIVFARVPEGQHWVTILADGFRSQRQRLQVADGQTLRVRIALPPLPDRESAPRRSLVYGTVADAGSEDPISSARVRVGSTAVITDSAGYFSLRVEAGNHRLIVGAYGFTSLDSVVTVSRPQTALEVLLQPEPFLIEPLTVSPTQSDRNREMFEREPRPGVLVLEGDDVQDMPAFVEPDVLRTLQATPGIVSRNDLSANLHVRGGGPDQNLFLIDGARVFAPYHLFGMMGLINADAVSHVDVFRGSIPARHGGAVSSVIDIHQRDGTEFPGKTGGLSFLGLRGTAGGELPVGEGSWLLAVRRTHADVVAQGLMDRDFPYAFWDLNSRVTAKPRPDQMITVSGIASSDRFELITGGEAPDFSSSWSNRAASVRWQRLLAKGTVSALFWTSGYGVDLMVDGPGSAGEPSRTGSGAVETGGGFDWIRPGNRLGFRSGFTISRLEAEIEGSETSTAFISGVLSDSRSSASAYLELESRLGSFRLSPGVRATLAGSARENLIVEPRLAARWNLTSEVALSLSAQQTHQYLSSLRDDRYPLPGPPLFFVHPDEAPPTRMDEVAASLDSWFGGGVDASLSAYARRFHAVPRWRPVGERTIDQLKYDEGRGAGVELALRKRTGRLTGWLGYTHAVVELSGDDLTTSYYAPWDRRHALDGTAFVRAWKDLHLSTRVNFGTGTPYWSPVGVVLQHGYVPGRGIAQTGNAPVWSESQDRFPPYFRADLGLSYRHWVGRAEVEASLTLLNVTGRSNVLYYRFPNMYTRHSVGGRPGEPRDQDVWLQPVGQLPLPRFPSLGITVSF